MASSAMFQSSSGQKAGCNGQWSSRRAGCGRCFNPHPARRPDATRIVDSFKPRRLSEFQSSSGQKAGCNAAEGAGWRVRDTLFQSSSGQKAGCNAFRDVVSWTTSRAGGFNPHPARRPDATPCRSWSQPVIAQSFMFQSSSGQKAGCNVQADSSGRYLPQGVVSILIRPEGRMQPGCQAAQASAALRFRFQSSSGQKAGCNEADGSTSLTSKARVSILIRPEGRMQPRGRCRGDCCDAFPFQSSSGQKAGCNSRVW